MGRWFVLFLTCCMVFGNYYAFDIPAALNTPLDLYLDTPHYQYYLQLLYSLYSVPNMILPFIGGWLIDRLGVPKLLLALSATITIGQLLFAVAIQIKSIHLMLFSRFVFGIGGESLAVMQSKITSKWFWNKELSLALSLNICVGRMGSVLNDLMSPWIANQFNVPSAAWFGFLTCLASFACAIYLAKIESKQPDNHESQTIHGIPLIKDKSKTLFQKSDFSIGFWLLLGIIICLYATMIPFNTIHAALLEYKFYPGDSVKAAQIMTVPDTIAVIFVPLVGILVDRYGHRAKLLAVCSLLLFIVHLYFYQTPKNSGGNPIPILSVMGVAYSMMVTLWSCIPLLVNARVTATAFGIATSALNTSLSIFPMIVAHLISTDPTYTSTELFFITCTIFGFATSIILYILNQYQNLHLETRTKTEENEYSTLENPEIELVEQSNYSEDTLDLNWDNEF
ncbi:major facilitator superfamily domain-containing protein [Globomyces pollinis-pini]|nr:major facilitator superfamily domain-containing protein [Globomyces pollinis-pini]